MTQHTPPTDATPVPDGPTRRGIYRPPASSPPAPCSRRPAIVQAAADHPAKVGFIEDESGNLSVYGMQKLHAAQLAVKEINDGKTLVGGPVGTGSLGSDGLYVAQAAAVTSNRRHGLNVVNDGGAPGEGGSSSSTRTTTSWSIRARRGCSATRCSLVSADGQSNNALWQQLARRMIQQDKVDVLVAGFASAEREAIRPIVDQFKQLYFYTNQYEGGVADANTFCTGAGLRAAGHPDRAVHGREVRPALLHDRRRL